MKKLVFILIISASLSCASGNKKDELKEKNYTYGNSTEKSIKSNDKIDNNTTYQLFFTLDNDTECIKIEIEAVYLQKSFPVQKIPKKAYFIVEKELILPVANPKNRIKFVPIGRNFNNDWEVFTPVKICTIKNDPLSILNKSRYRVRFTTFEKLTVYYVITINSDAGIAFIEETGKPGSKKK